MKKAVVTGASSGIGKAITERLLSMGYEVYGIGRVFAEKTENKEYHRIVCDLLDEKQLDELVRTLPVNEISLLVNNAGAAYYGMHEELNPAKIRIMTRTDLEVPMILCQKFLRALKKNRGTILNIASVTANQVNTHGATYGAAKAGLLSFGRSLFEENRKYGIRVVTLLPDMTGTNLYRNADFQPSDEPGTYLLAEDIADAAAYILSCREDIVITEMTIRPQLHRIERKK